jgi:hypothetical protein
MSLGFEDQFIAVRFEVTIWTTGLVTVWPFCRFGWRKDRIDCYSKSIFEHAWNEHTEQR